MPRIFISHSRVDAELTKNIAALLLNIGIEPFVMEYSPKSDSDSPPWPMIREEVEKSDSVILMKTENAIKTQYTMSWIIFETGLAAALNKPLFVFEKRGSDIEFPIPYLTDYMLFNDGQVADFLKIQALMKDWNKEKAIDVPEGGILSGFFALALLAMEPKLVVVAALLGGMAELVQGPIDMECPKCSSEYNYYAGVLDSFRCPVCLFEITPTEGLDQESIQYLQAFKKKLDEANINNQ